MATTVHIPLAPLSVRLSDANAFWVAKDGTNFDYSHFGFLDAVTGVVTFWGIVPENIAGTPAWNLVLHSHGESGAGGDVVLTVSALDFATNVAKDQALTALITDTAVTISTSANTTHSTLSGTNFDGTEAIAAGNYLVVEVQRVGGNANDTLGVQWNLAAVVLEVDVI